MTVRSPIRTMSAASDGRHLIGDGALYLLLRPIHTAVAATMRTRAIAAAVHKIRFAGAVICVVGGKVYTVFFLEAKRALSMEKSV